jgi:hypothetical protein
LTSLSKGSPSAIASGSAKPAPRHLTIGYVDIAGTVGVEPQIYNVFAKGAASRLDGQVRRRSERPGQGAGSLEAKSRLERLADLGQDTLAPNLAGWGQHYSLTGS